MKVACLSQVFDVLLLVFIYLKQNNSFEMPLQADRTVKLKTNWPVLRSCGSGRFWSSRILDPFVRGTDPYLSIMKQK
jgi:hypothetical protein